MDKAMNSDTARLGASALFLILSAIAIMTGSWLPGIFLAVIAVYVIVAGNLIKQILADSTKTE
ncbi:hypothetical protein C4559_01595 [Candidatus Microgenomates bacterium]|nr:MAG: hypothetical protein C4559_01595 [Candidatus Microgenomates bacterium]